MKKTFFLFTICVLMAPLGRLSAQQEVRTPADTLLLKQFRPRSVFNIPETRVEKPRYTVIDAHSHDYAKNREEVARWVKNMDAAGIQEAHLMSCNWIGRPYEEYIADYRDHLDRFRFWCSFDYTDFDKPDWEERALASLQSYYEMGFTGVGEMGDKGDGDLYGLPVEGRGIHLDHPKLIPLFTRCAELEMPVNVHIAEPIWMYLPIDRHNDGLMGAAGWAIDTTQVDLGYHGLMSSFERAVAQNPSTIFIACHYLNMTHDWPRLSAMLDKYPNLFLDLSARIAEAAVTPRATREFFIKYADRILFGTDNGMGTEMYRSYFRILESADEHIITRVPGHYWPLSGLDLPDDVLEKVYRGNALRLFKHR